MIVLTRLNGTRFAVNLDLIERIQSTPDTTLSLVSGTSYVVREPLDAVLDMIADYRVGILARARSMPAAEAPQVIEAVRGGDGRNGRSVVAPVLEVVPGGRAQRGPGSEAVQGVRAQGGPGGEAVPGARTRDAARPGGRAQGAPVEAVTRKGAR